MRRAALVVTLAALSTIGGGWEANACSCGALTPAAALKAADVAFAGLVTAVVDGPAAADPRTVTFDVAGVYKGTVQQVAFVQTPARADDCGIDFVPSRRYTVFAQRDGTTLRSQICDATTADATLLDAVATARSPSGDGGDGPGPSGGGSFPLFSLLVVLAGAAAITAWRRRSRSAR